MIASWKHTPRAASFSLPVGYASSLPFPSRRVGYASSLPASNKNVLIKAFVDWVILAVANQRWQFGFPSDLEFPPDSTHKAFFKFIDRDSSKI